MKKITTAFRRHPYVYSAVLAVIVAIVIFIIATKNGNGFETIVVARGDFKRSVSISGKVIAAQSAELGFEQGGRIAGVYAPVGTEVAKGALLASIENGDARADVLQRQASLARERAKLASLSQGTRPEEIAIDRQSYTDASRALVVAIRTAALDAENAMLTQIDTVFSNGNSVNPQIDVRTRSDSEEVAIERDRLKITELLEAWKTDVSKLSNTYDSTTLEKASSAARLNLLTLKSFADRIISIVNDLSVSNSGLSQAEIDSFRSSAISAGQDINDAMDSLQTTEAAWSKARATLTLSESGSTRSDIEAQEATVKAAEADLLAAQAKLAKTQVIAPFGGIVTRMDAKVGEIISPNTSKISLMSSSSFEIESFVPEVHIAYIKPGNPVTATLDAYGTNETFRATVISIDPAETIRDAVSTYKVKMSFDAPDPRIRSGMTASAVIVTLEKKNSIVLPRSVVTARDGQSYVKVLRDGETAEVAVLTGDSTSLGQIEIVSGLEEGDVVILEE